MDIRELKTELSNRALALSHALLPDGKVEGENWVVGSLSGEPG